MQGDFGELELETPRDRQATFEPEDRGQAADALDRVRRQDYFDVRAGHDTREIQGHLEEMYGIEVSPTLISNVTDAVVEEVKQWQGRPLDEVYPIVYLDALMVKVREKDIFRTRRFTWCWA